MIKEKILASYTFRYTEKSTGTAFIIGGLTKTGDQKPYFSLTVNKIFRHRDVGGGAAHEEILARHPRFADLAKLHLSDVDGVPMYAEQNGWYWLAGYYGGADERYHGGNGKIQHWKGPVDSYGNREFDGYRESTPEECLQIFADHVRVSYDEAFKLAESWITTVPPDWKKARSSFAAWVELQKPRWQAEARAAIEKYHLPIVES